MCVCGTGVAPPIASPSQCTGFSQSWSAPHEVCRFFGARANSARQLQARCRRRFLSTTSARPSFRSFRHGDSPETMMENRGKCAEYGLPFQHSVDATLKLRVLPEFGRRSSALVGVRHSSSLNTCDATSTNALACSRLPYFEGELETRSSKGAHQNIDGETQKCHVGFRLVVPCGFDRYSSKSVL